MDEEKVKQEAEALIQDMQSNPNRFATYVANNAPSVSTQDPVVSTFTQPFTTPTTSSPVVSAPTQTTETETTTQSKQNKDDKKKYGKHSKEDFLDRDGDLILKSDLLRNIRYNLDSYLESRGLNQKETTAFREALGKLIDGIKGGTVIPTNPGHADVLKDIDTIKNSEKGFDSYGEAYKYVDFIFNKQKVWTNPDADKPEDVFSSDSFTKALNKELFGGREDFDETFWGQDPWDETNKTRGTQNRTALVVSKLQKLRNDVANGTLFGDSDDTQKNNTLGYIDEAIKALSDSEVSEQDRLILSNLGIDYDKYFGTRETYNSEIEQPEDDGMTDEERTLLKQMEESNRQMRLLMGKQQLDSQQALLQWYQMGDNTEEWKPLQYRTNHNYSSFYDQIKGDTSQIDGQITASIGQIQKNLENGRNPMADVSYHGGYTNLKKGNQSITLYNKDWSWSEKLDAILQFAYKHPNKFSIPLSKDGHLVLATDKSGMAYCYNPQAHQLYKKSVKSVFGQNSTEFQTAFNYHYGNTPSTQSQGLESQVVSQKNGGILKAQWGLSINDGIAMRDAAVERARLLKEQETQAKKKELEDAASKSGRTIEQYKAGQEKLVERGLKTEDGLRIAAAAADITALIASFAPGAGTAVSAAAGLTSLGLDLTADAMDDSVNGWQVAKNAAANLGLSLVSLIPGGGAGKVFKSAKRILPLAIQAYNSMGVIMDKNVQESVNKMFNGKEGDFTVDDWKNVLSVFKVITSAGTTAGTLTKAAKYRKITAPTETDKVRIKTKDGSTVELTKSQIKEIDDIGFKEGTEAANTKFKEITKNLGSEKELSDKVKYKTKWPFKEKRSSTLTGETVYNQTLTRDNIEARAYSMYLKQKHPELANVFNTDYDIFVNNKTPFAFLNNIHVTTPWSKKMKEARARHDKLLADRAAKRAASRAAAASSTPKSDYSWRHLSGSFKPRFINLGAKDASGNFKYKNADGTLNDKAIKFLDNIDSNWRNNHYSGYKFKDYFNSKTSGKKLTADPENTVVGSNFIAFWKQGNKINQAKELSKKKFAKGGILKFETGGNFLTKWYGTGDGFSSLSGWNNTLNQSSAGPTIVGNGHYNAGSLDEVLNRINAYTTNQNLVGEDIQHYYDSDGASSSLEDFVTKYNQDAARLRNFFKEKRVYNTKDQSVRDHNQLFKRMFGHRSSAETNAYNIGYQDNLDDVLGSSTWLRRVDMYDKAWEDLTNEEKLKRVHKIKLGNGTEGYVYKKDYGDIGILSADQYNQLLNPSANPDSTTENSDVSKQDGEKGGVDASGDKPVNNNDALARAWALKMASPLIDIDRFARTLRTNNQVKKIWDKVNHPVLLDTYERFSPVTGDFLGMQVMTRANADRMRAIDRAGQRTQEQNLAMFLEGQQANTQNSYAAAQQNDARIRETAKEALMRQEDNAARWSQTDNQNRQAIHQAELAQAQTENDYKIKQNEAFQNFLMGLQNTANTEWTNYQQYLQNAKALEIQNKYANELNDLLVQAQKEASDGNKSVYHTGAYQLYKAKAQEMNREIAMANYYTQTEMGIYPKWKFPFTFKPADVSQE